MALVRVASVPVLGKLVCVCVYHRMLSAPHRFRSSPTLSKPRLSCPSFLSACLRRQLNPLSQLHKGRLLATSLFLLLLPLTFLQAAMMLLD